MFCSLYVMYMGVTPQIYLRCPFTAHAAVFHSHSYRFKISRDSIATITNGEAELKN